MLRAALAAITLAAPAAASDFRLSLPLDCRLGQTCHIQQYMDRDPGPGAADYRCGALVYDGHKGTDFALPTLADMARGVDVLAAAPGEVTALRDGMADREATADDPAVQNRECGNGVVIRHANGWETQYCHMKQGSIAVTQGQQVDRGTPLGQVGLSGATQFPHVHLSVRRDGAEVDPFDSAGTEACGDSDPQLWQDPIPYWPGGLIDAGFAPGVPDYAAIRAGTAAAGSLAPDAPGLVLFGLAYGGRKGDSIELAITGPAGQVIRQTATLDKDQAQFFRAAGKKRPAGGWPAGRYLGTVTLIRDGAVLDTMRREISLR